MSKKRYFSMCALIKTIDGQSVVAIVGGRYAQSKGMEIWNPSDGSIKTVLDAFPLEVLSTTGNTFFAFFCLSIFTRY